MKNLYKLSLLSLLFIFMSVSVMSQTKQKFGHINTQKVLIAMPEYKAIEVTVQAETAKMEKQLTDMKETFQKQVEEYQKTANGLSLEERSKKEQELSERSQKVQNFFSVAQKSLEEKARQLHAPVAAKLQAAIDAVGQEAGLTYIFEVEPGLPLYHSAQSVDVAPLVLAKLALSAPKATPAAASAPKTTK